MNHSFLPLKRHINDFAGEGPREVPAQGEWFGRVAGEGLDSGNIVLQGTHIVFRSWLGNGAAPANPHR